MNDKQRILLKFWLFAASFIFSMLIVIMLAWSFALPIVWLVIWLFTPHGKKLQELLKEDQDHSFKDYIKEYKKIFIVLVVYSSIVYPYVIFKIVTRWNRNTERHFWGPTALLLVP